MASAWGKSFGSAWGSAWGLIASVITPKGGGFSRKPKLAVITVDGQDYRVPIEKLPQFLSRIRDEVSQVGTVRKKQKKKVKQTAPVVRVKFAPVEYKATVQAEVDRTNELIAEMWSRVLARLINDLEDEEILVLLLAG